MGKLYDFNYHKPGRNSAGTMLCPACGNHIDGLKDEWRSAKRDKNGDWGYVCHHRNCCKDDPRWAANDAAEKKDVDRIASLTLELRELIARYPEYNIEDFLND